MARLRRGFFNSALWNMTATAWKGKVLIERGAFRQGVVMVRQAVYRCEQTGWGMCHAEFLAEGLAGTKASQAAVRAMRLQEDDVHATA